MITRGELKGQILRFLNKTSQFRGFYDDAKIDDAIQEALDFIAVEMFTANEGWQLKIAEFDTVAGQVTVDLPFSVAMIKEVRYLYAAYYEVMRYDDASGRAQASTQSGQRQFFATYRIVDNRLYFNPPLSEGGPKFLQVEYMTYPKRMEQDTDYLESQFDPCMTNYLKYRCATILSASLEKANIPWSSIEASWYNKLVTLLNRRNMQSVPIRNFM